MSLTLTPAELVELTGKQRPSAQARVLSALGIPYQIRPNGSLLILRSRLETENERPASSAVRLPQARRVLAG